MDRFNAAALAYCQMGNHCHFVLHTHRANLSRLLHHLLEWRVRAVICTALRASRTQRLALLQRKQVLAAPQGRTLTLARIRTEVLN